MLYVPYKKSRFIVVKHKEYCEILSLYEIYLYLVSISIDDNIDVYD